MSTLLRTEHIGFSRMIAKTIRSSLVCSQARNLRQQGWTYTEICDRLGPIPKGTLAYWFKGIRLSAPQRARIREKIVASAAMGRPLAREVWAKKIARWREKIEARVHPFGRLPYTNQVIGKLVCGIMYLCEGGKYPASRQLLFGNTDPGMIQAFLTLLRQYYSLQEHKLRIRVMHRWDQDGKALNRYWSGVTRIPLSQFYHSYADQRTKGRPTRKPAYKGVCCVQYGDTDLQYELQAIGEAVLKSGPVHFSSTVEIRPYILRRKIMVEQRGIEPRASTLPASRSPN